MNLGDFMAKVGDTIQIHSFKHDQSIHRIWDKAKILEMNDTFIVLANERTRVLESNGKSWFTKEPAICFFFKNQWYNVICMLKDSGVHYYCNLGSPYTIDDEAVKYIDYDLDIKVFPNNTYKILDKFEYQINADAMKYPKEIKRIIKSEMEDLKKRIKQKGLPFEKETVHEYYKIFEEMKDERS